MWPFSSKKKTYKLTPTQELLLELLRAQLWLKPVDDILLPTTMEEWDALMDISYRQTVVCFISAACLRHKDVDEIPTGIREEMEAVIEENKKIHEYHNNIIVEVFSLLENKGLHPILLKGQGLAQLYPQPELRQCGDIDIYIGQADYEKACCIMDNYCGPDAKQNAFYEDRLHYHISNGSVTFEIHRKAADAAKLYKDREFNEWAYECLKPEKCEIIFINNKSILIPNARYNTLFVFDHLIKHIRCEGVNIRQFCDWLMMLRSKGNSTDKGLLYSDLKRYSSFKAWQILGGILVYQLGYDKNKFPYWNEVKSSKSQSFLLKEIINGCSFCIGSRLNDTHKFYKNRIIRTLWSIKVLYQSSKPIMYVSTRAAFSHFCDGMYRRIVNNLKGEKTI